MHYSSHWRLSFLLALIFHFLLWSGATFILPKLLPEPQMGDLGTAIELEDVSEFENASAEGGENDNDMGTPDGAEDGSEDGNAPAAAGQMEDTATAEEAGAYPSQIGSAEDAAPQQAQEAQAAAQPAAAPEKPETPPEPPKDAAGNELTETSPIIADDETAAIAALQKEIKAAEGDPKKKVSQIVIRKKGSGNVTMGQPPKLIADSYPAVGLDKFHGRVSVFATIGKDGTIKKTKVAVTSGQRFIDEIAMAACRRWKFKPALDGKGQPMECIRVISIPFNVPNIERQIEERG